MVDGAIAASTKIVFDGIGTDLFLAFFETKIEQEGARDIKIDQRSEKEN